jgi:hypothetical protein
MCSAPTRLVAYGHPIESNSTSPFEPKGRSSRFNVADFGREARGYADEDRDHCGIIVSDQLEVGELVRRLTRVLGRYSATEMVNRFVWLQSFA